MRSAAGGHRPLRRKYSNAFWNGEQMVFGDGDRSRSTASPDRWRSSATN
ncbi:MAG: hypothetical protein IPK19_42105 [Chloroflexi bacterium]|nr:hypothetical protein [Chloroflexota bacterium]